MRPGDKSTAFNMQTDAGVWIGEHPVRGWQAVMIHPDDGETYVFTGGSVAEAWAAACSAWDEVTHRNVMVSENVEFDALQAALGMCTPSNGGQGGVRRIKALLAELGFEGSLQSVNVTPVEPEKAVKGEYVYVIGEAGDKAPVKIGYSVNVPSRLKALQTGYPHKLHVRAVLTSTGIKLEQALHTYFQAERLTGEWFTCSARMVDFFTRMGVPLHKYNTLTEA